MGLVTASFRCAGAISLYEWVVMTFGLNSARATFWRAMNYIFHDPIGLLVGVYIDDVVVKSKEVEDHIADLRKVFERTRKYGLKMNPTKCAFGVSAGQFLGFLVHERGIEVNQRSINVIKKIQPLEDKKQLQKLIGEWRHYLLSNECTLVCKADVVKYMLSAPVLKGRIGKWIYALTEFDLQYESPLHRVYAIADFIVEHRDDSIGSVDIVPWTLFFDGSRMGYRYNRSNQSTFILVATDYFTKWVEAIPLKKVDSGDAIQFVKEHIIYRFGIPQTITIDQGSIFVSDEFVQFADSMGIQLLNFSPYCAQANGQAKASNKSLIKLIKRKIFDFPRQWHTRLAEALWSYQMACHGSILVPPYKLVYGHEAVLPWEIKISSRRIDL
uniref:Retrotransposon protein, putative, unclassified n=1 Tax=Oryza sativa subsp. japonica TaxID=39947 RepID=Q2QPQ1_ORYSJ|nr:retrotransposon protein, putative, unclassified [Oryza sativa Japonica Group]